MADSFDHELIRRAFRIKLMSLPEFPGGANDVFGRLQCENRPFTPPNPPDIYMRETLLPALEDKPAFGMLGASGFVQYDIIVPKGSGTEKADALAKAIKAAFKPDSDVSLEGLDIAIDAAVQQPGRDFDDMWFQIPIILEWRSYVFLS